MRTKILIICFILFGFLGYSQSKEIYTNPDFVTLTKDHKILAIIPFKASVMLRPKQIEKMGQEQFDKLQLDQGKSVQSAMQTYFLSKREDKGFAVTFQDIAKTNAILMKSNITNANIESYTSQELAKMLEVDGVISGSLSTDKPMSDGASIALGLVVGFYGATNSGKCTININDGKTGDLLWKYEKTLARSLGSDINTIIDAMMRKSSRKFPYIIPE
jgi:hypothetical protein